MKTEEMTKSECIARTYEIRREIYQINEVLKLLDKYDAVFDYVKELLINNRFVISQERNILNAKLGRMVE